MPRVQVCAYFREGTEVPQQPLPQLPSTSSVLLHNVSSSSERGR